MNEYTYQVPRYTHMSTLIRRRSLLTMSTLTRCRATYREHTYFGYRPPAPPRAAAPPSAPAATEWWRWPGELRAAHDTYTREAQEWAEQCGGNFREPTARLLMLRV